MGALERVETCDCGEETSCYGCLRNYKNQRIHDILRRDLALKVLRRIGPLEHAGPRPEAATTDRRDFPHVDGGIVLADTFTGQTKAIVLTDGRILMHGEIYADPQQAANAADHNVNALDFWAAELPTGPRSLRSLLQ